MDAGKGQGWVLGRHRHLSVNRALKVRLPQEMREFTSFGVVSLFPEGDNRVDMSGSKSWNIARHKGHGKKHGGDAGEC